MDPRRILACGRCSAKGPHRTFVYRAGGLSVLCRACSADEEAQHATGDSSHVLHPSPSRET